MELAISSSMKEIESFALRMTGKTIEELRQPITQEQLQERVDHYNNKTGELTGYDCPICKNKGDIEIIVGQSTQIQFCKCRQIRISIGRMERSGMKDKFSEYTFENYKALDIWQKNIKQQAIDFCNTSGSWFFIGGQVGAGKTHICTAIACRLMKRGLSAKYMLWRDEVVKIKAVVNKDEEYYQLIQPLKDVDILYIDNFFRTGKDEKGSYKQPSAGDINVAFELLNYRYNNKSLITILSSERTIGEIITMDEAIGSRIFQRSKGFEINIKRNKDRNYRLRDFK